MSGTPHPDIAAVILAAGLSSRMGSLKALLPFGTGTVLEHISTAYRKAGVTNILVVTGHNAGMIGAEAARLGLGTVHNPGYLEGMFSSACTGLAAVLEAGYRHVFVHPVDIPLVRFDTLARMAEYGPGLEADLCLPAFGGECGHPPLLDARVLPQILSWQGEGGLKAAFSGLARCEIPVADQAVLLDMDTPEAYQKALLLLERSGIPSTGEAYALLRLHQVPEKGIAHGRAVSLVARALAEALNATGATLDVQLAESAAVLHDIAKGQPRHEETGGKLLRGLGFVRLENIVASHRDRRLAENCPILEADVVYLADKLVRGAGRMSIPDRFAEKIIRYQLDAEATAAICLRRDNALHMAACFEAATGRQLEDVLKPLDLPWNNL